MPGSASRRRHAWLCCAAVCGLLIGILFPLQAGVVINEIHYNPDVKTEHVEFVELYNTGPGAADISGWQLVDGITYTFSPGTIVASNGYVVVAENPAAVTAKFAYGNVLGPYLNHLSAYGEKISLRDATGGVQDEVNFSVGFPWPTVGDAPGYSIELINPTLDNDLGGSWRASVTSAAQPGTNVILIQSNSTWKYFKGRTEASSPATAWRQLNFNDSAWLSGSAPIGYGESFVATPLSDMRSNYTAVFFRKTFVVQDPSTFSNLVLRALYDDGFKLWINGSNVLNLNISTAELPYNGTAGSTRENNTYNVINLINPASYLVPGTNIIAIQAHNSSINGSSDFFVDVRLESQSGSIGFGPTPGRVNSVLATNAPPQIRQVEHVPEQPRSGDPVRITAKVTDPNGVASVTLQYQVVLPGEYIEIADAIYNTSWTTAPMQDGGANGDLVAGDDIYSVLIPASVQAHRRLIRYRITVTDTLGSSVRVPYADDPQPNFAYFVYDGAPGWSGAVQPGATGSNGVAFTVSSNAMNRLPIYHLIGRNSSIASATWFSRYLGDAYPWQGTLVYDGKVYDNIHFRARGGAWRYAMVKNMWKFDMNRGHDFEARDNWGRKYKTKWNKLNLGANIQQADFNHRGEQGMFESVGFRLFQLGDVAAPNTTFVTLRVVDDAQETNPTSQFESDFWGVYLAVEQENGRLLEEHDLPDSNLYKMDYGYGTPPADLNNLGPNGPIDKSDINYIYNNYNNLSEQWWRTNWNFGRYYNWEIMVQAINDFDINYDKNYFFYFDPRTRLWEPLPWDLDLSWFNWTYSVLNRLATGILQATPASGTGPQTNSTVLKLTGARPGVEREFRNRVREIRDLLYNTNEACRLIDEYAALLQGPTNGPTILDADRAQWDYNPKMADPAYSAYLTKAGHGKYYQFPNESATNAALRGSFGGAVQIMKNYVVLRSQHLDTLAADDAIPNTPALVFTGPVNYPISRLSFHSSAFSSPFVTNQFAAVQWRVVEVSTNAPSYLETEPLKYETEGAWQFTNTSPVLDLTLPTTVVKVGSTYRARVRMWDAVGRASHWSAPIEFTVGEPEAIADLLTFLRITEVMYNPPTGGYEYVELHNISESVTLELSGVKFTQGIDYTFPAGATLAPHAYLLVTKASAANNFSAFRSFYGLSAGVAVFGPFSGSLDNAGEQLTLRTSAGGTDIVAFHYNDSRGWPQGADGAGSSLVIVDGAEAMEGTGTGEYGGNWRSSTYLKGSPGRADTFLPTTILINEIAASTSYYDPAQPQFDSNDWIELYNSTDTNVVLGPGWYLSDDGAVLTKWAIPSGTVVPARGFVVFDEVTGFHNPITTGFGLSSDGEQVFLSYLPGGAGNRIVDAINFKAQEQGVSLGRYPDGSPFWLALDSPTRGASNAAPSLHVVLNEIHYHPPDIGGVIDNALDEFIEVFNPTATAMDLFNTNGGWRLDGDVGFVFSNNLTLGAGEYLLLVNFNPGTNAMQLAAFRNLYGISNASLAILGPYSNGKLPNSSARLALEKPLAGSITGLVWSVVDEVIYADQFPWSCGADGTGSSIQRVEAIRDGSDPSNWSASRPTPGVARSPEPPGLATILGQPLSRIIATNSDVTFSLSICGTPPFTYQWRFNGMDIVGATNATLTVHAVQTNDAGSYNVVISNLGGSVVSDAAMLLVQYLPLIITPPQSHTANIYDSTTFTVVPDGTPPFQYQWLFNGVNIVGATNQTLVLTNLQPANEGSYSVRVMNAVGSAFSGAAVFSLTYPARVTVPPQDIITNNGVDVLFGVAVSGFLPLSYQWRFQGAEIPGATNASLILSNVIFEDSGAYSVFVSNAYGSQLSSAAMLLVQELPSIVTHPQSHTASAFGSTSFSVEPGGTPPFRYQWRFNGVDISGATNQTLALTNIQPTQDGRYSVLMMNLVGSVLSDEAVLLLSLAAHVVVPPQNLTTNPGVNVMFSADVTGSAPLSYQWRFEGTNILNATNATLVISNTALEHNGNYSLFVSNVYGSDLSAPAMLTVLVKPAVTEQPPSLTLAVGDTAVIGVKAYGLQPMSFRWVKNAISYIPATIGLSNIVLTNLSLMNAGQYRAAITNPATTSSVNSRSETLIVVVPPTNQVVEPGSSVAIRGILSGYAPSFAPLAYAWEHNGVILFSTNQSGTGTVIVTNDLRLNNVNEYDSGIYNLLVTNTTPVGSNSSSVFVTAFPVRLTVTVFGPPAIIEQPTNLTVTVGGNASFNVVAAGIQPMVYQWWFNETNRIENGTNATLALFNVAQTDSGKYHVVVSNLLGSVASTKAILALATNGISPAPGGFLSSLSALFAPSQPGVVLIRFEVSANQACVLETATNIIGSWSTLLNVPAVSTNRTVTVTNVISGGSPRHFFRLSGPGP